MKNVRKNLFVATTLLMGATSMMRAQCVDMSSFDTGKKSFVNADITLYGQEKKIVGGTELTISTYGWGYANAPATHPRVTLMTEPGTDDLCEELSVLPPNQPTSIRLMSDNYQELDSAKGSLIFLSLTVDADNPLILVNYAAVLEDPKHNVANKYPDHAQPHCGFYAVAANEQGTGLDTIGFLQHYPSVANSIKGWKSFNNEKRGNITTFWKDWSTVALDLSEYAGKLVNIRLETYDCAVRTEDQKEGPILCFDRHLGRMYAHVTCAPKELVFRKDCEGKEDSVFITAPEGFSYRWYEKKDKETTLSTDRELRIPAADEDATYVCELTNHVGIFELEQAVDAPEIIDEGEVKLDFGKSHSWHGQDYSITGDYEYIEYYTDKTDLEHYSKSCAKKIYRIHIEGSKLDCPNTLTLKDSICGDAKGFNVSFHYDRVVDESDKENPITIEPSVVNFTVDFPDNWNSQEGETIQIDENTSIVKKGYGDITKAIEVNGIAMDSVINIPMPLDSVYYDLTDEWVYAYPRPDNYTMTLTIQNSCGQKETHEVPFAVLYPSNVIYQRWNDILSVKNEHFNGGNPIATVRWFRNNQEVIGRGEHHSYIHSGDFSSDKNEKLNSNDSFYAELTRSNDGKTFCTCRFRPTDLGRDEKPEFKGEFNLAPRRNDNRQVEVISTTSGQYTLYDLTGRPLQNGLYGELYGAPDILIDATITRGTYLLLFRSDEGEQVTKKWIVK